MPTLPQYPNVISNGDVPDADLLMADLQHLRTFLNSTKLDNANIQDGGLATANYANGSVTTGKLADNAVTAAKLNLLQVVAAQAAAQTSLTTSYQSMATIATPAVGTYLFFGNATYASTSASVTVFFKFDDDVNPRAEDWVTLNNSPVSQSIVYVRTVNGAENVSIQAKTDTNPAGTVKNANGIETRVLGVRIG
jgi:hypothetical protein